MNRMLTVLATAMALTAVASCGGRTDPTGTGEPASHDLTTGESEPGTITVRIEEVDVPESGRADIEVTFGDPYHCLRQR